MLSLEQKRRYERDGFVVLEGFVDDAAADGLCARAQAIVDEFNPGDVAHIFTTNRQTRALDDYFLESADKISCFFEEEAFDDAGALKQTKARSINKIGHAMHDLDPVFERFSRNPGLAALVADLGLDDPRIIQSMYIFKQPRIGGEVRWHQDTTFLMTEPHSVRGFWFALEDATRDNGCLWAIPGGHKGPLRERFYIGPNRKAVMEVLDETPFDTANQVPLEVPKGTLVAFDGRLPHYSAPNRSQHSRHAYTLHVVDGGCAYAADNWLQRSPENPARGFT